jgi:hypothetical protein
MIPLSDIEPFLDYLDNNYVNTALCMKVNGMNRQSNDFWNVEEISQVLSFDNIERFKSSYELFRNSSIDVEYIQYKSFQTSVKIYVSARRLIITIKDSVELPDLQIIRDYATNMNISNIVISLKLD